MLRKVKIIKCKHILRFVIIFNSLVSLFISVSHSFIHFLHSSLSICIYFIHRAQIAFLIETKTTAMRRIFHSVNFPPLFLLLKFLTIFILLVLIFLYMYTIFHFLQPIVEVIVIVDFFFLLFLEFIDRSLRTYTQLLPTTT